MRMPIEVSRFFRVTLEDNQDFSCDVAMYTRKQFTSWNKITLIISYFHLTIETTLQNQNLNNLILRLVIEEKNVITS